MASHYPNNIFLSVSPGKETEVHVLVALYSSVGEEGMSLAILGDIWLETQDVDLSFLVLDDDLNESRNYHALYRSSRTIKSFLIGKSCAAVTLLGEGLEEPLHVLDIFLTRFKTAGDITNDGDRKVRAPKITRSLNTARTCRMLSLDVGREEGSILYNNEMTDFIALDAGISRIKSEFPQCWCGLINFLYQIFKGGSVMARELDNASCAYDDQNDGDLHSAQPFYFHFQFRVFLQFPPGLLLEVISCDAHIYKEGGLLLLLINHETTLVEEFSTTDSGWCSYHFSGTSRPAYLQTHQCTYLDTWSCLCKYSLGANSGQALRRMAGVLFEDIFDVKDIDPEGKKFDRDITLILWPI
ncbi:unnamed protein product [Darwinula stevensoni]|uniref:Uncharacterized protein n=1 Tax=Darwinula stevensoni TaxID=69355 RepID=A0A7R9A5Z7_9CRUS|nr:unnamed protein product [Darwinula stevensoni]CAG0886402.1 unnamed protein product [Darwinula stevensoni]